MEEKTLPLYSGSSVIGSVICREEERHFSFNARTYATLRGICRAYVKGADGNLLIGVLSPDGASFSAQKTISKSELHDSGLTFAGITYAYALCSQNSTSDDISDWKKLENPPDILRRDEAIYALAKSTGAICDNDIFPKRIALPLITGRPFPRPDVLCLLTPCEIGGELYGIIGISKSGSPERI